RRARECIRLPNFFADRISPASFRMTVFRSDFRHQLLQGWPRFARSNLDLPRAGNVQFHLLSDAKSRLFRERLWQPNRQAIPPLCDPSFHVYPKYIREFRMLKCKTLTRVHLCNAKWRQTLTHSKIRSIGLNNHENAEA